MNERVSKPTPSYALIPPMPAPKSDKGDSSQMLNVSLSESNIIQF